MDIAREIIEGRAVVLNSVTMALRVDAQAMGLKVYATKDLQSYDLKNKRAELVNWATVRWLKECAK